MDIFYMILSMLGGLALFLFGMTTMGTGLEKMSGGRLERILEKTTGNVVYGVLMGAAVTGVIQSSSATTVMLVGFVNAGIMRLSQAVGVIMGANIGTTVTAQLLRLSSLSSDNAIVSLFKPSTFAPILMIVGVVFYMFSKPGRRTTAGQLLLGLGVLFTGMDLMSGAVKSSAAAMEAFKVIFATLSNPLLGVLAGAVITAIIQSSSASVGILQAISQTGTVPFSAAAPIILGQNIGTCITAVLSSFGASKNAKRVAAVHLYFNVIGTVVFLTGMYLVKGLLPFWDNTASSGMIATFHTVFNLGTTLLLLPFNRLLEKLAILTLPDGKEKKADASILDERFLASPSLALEQSRQAVLQMGHYAEENFELGVSLLKRYDEKQFERLRENEDTIDRLETRLTHYVMALNDRDLTPEENMIQVELLHSKGDMERIGDYVMNLAEAAQEMSRKNLNFSSRAQEELTAICSAIREVLDITLRCYEGKNPKLARRVEPLEEVIDLMDEFLRDTHIGRLKAGQCTLEAGTLFLEILINLERISDHCANVALYIVQTYGMGPRRALSFDPYQYVRALHEGDIEEFNAYYKEYEGKYLPMLRQDNGIQLTIDDSPWS